MELKIDGKWDPHLDPITAKPTYKQTYSDRNHGMSRTHPEQPKNTIEKWDTVLRVYPSS